MNKWLALLGRHYGAFGSMVQAFSLSEAGPSHGIVRNIRVACQSRLAGKEGYGHSISSRAALIRSIPPHCAKSSSAIALISSGLIGQPCLLPGKTT